MWFAGSVNHHLLAQYTNSMLAIILQQFENKFVTGGVEGVIHMCQENRVLAAMLERFMGLTLGDMQACLESGRRGKPGSAKLPKLGFYVREIEVAEGEASYKRFLCCA